MSTNPGARTRRRRLFIALGALMGLLLAESASGAGKTASASLEQGGVALRFVHEPGGEGTGRARLTITDARTGRPIEGARPAAWMLLRRSEQVANEMRCEDKATMLSGGSLGQRSDVDLNGYRLLTLNHDNTVAFINPMVRVGTSQLESIVELPATGHDWVLAPQQQRLAVSLRDADAVALVDTLTRKTVATVPTGAGSQPTRLLMDPDGQRLWIGLDGAEAVLAIDVRDGRVLGRAAVGRGLHTLAQARAGPWLYVTNAAANSVSLVDRATLATAAEIPVPDTPVAAAWSEAAQRLVVLSANGGQLTLIDSQTRRVSATVPLARGALGMALFDEGRRALVSNPRTNTLSLVDLATARVVAERTLPDAPDQIAFTREFAYVRSQGSANVQLIGMGALREGRLDGPVVPMGRQAPDAAPDAFNVASVMTAAPEGGALLIANPADGSIYRYTQGLMVPSNSHSNYRRRARGLLVLDNSLTERTPGQFEAAVRVPQTGRYDVVVRNLRPALTACFTVALEGAPPNAEQRAAAARVKPRLLDSRASAGDELRVEFVLSKPDDAVVKNSAKAENTDSGSGPVTLLLVQRHGAWQARANAQPLGNGRYGAQLQGLPPGEFEAMVQAPALALDFAQGRLGRVRWPVQGDQQ